MTVDKPVTELDTPYSSEDATPTGWVEGRRQLEKAELYWLSTVRPDGRPHVTPLVGVWLEGAMYFTTGPDERKAKNLEHNTSCVITTGCNDLSKGLDLVIEGKAVAVRDDAKLKRVAGAFNSKYEAPFRFTVKDFALHGDGGSGKSLVFEVTPKRAFGYGRGKTFSATRWSF